MMVSLIVGIVALGTTPLKWTGADVSFVPQVERRGGKYKNRGKRGDPLLMMRANGQNLARIRIWNEPADDDCSVPQVLDLMKRCKRAGLKILLDFHYSDTWADPAHQIVPKAWKEFTTPRLVNAVHDFTREVLKKCAQQGTPPAIVQVGNEITGGMIWPKGKWDHFDDFAEMLRAGLSAVQEASTTKNPIQTMVHIDCGGDTKRSQWFFDQLRDRKVDYDLIGLSYYCWWHGSLTDLAGNLANLSQRFGKDVVVVETAYPWTMAPSPAHGPRLMGDASKLHPGFPATPAGQDAYLRRLGQVVREVPQGRGVGVVYWAPDWLNTTGSPSAGDNLNWFDYEGNALPALSSLASG